MKSLEFLLTFGIILLSTKVFSIFMEKIKIPQVVGAILSGIILGPSFLGILKESDFISQISEIGVIILMFLAGLETDFKDFKKNLLPSILIAILGILFPLFFGSLVYFIFFRNQYLDTIFILKAFFMGVILTATSVSITVETLKSMGKLNGKIGTLILCSAIIDDIVGMLILSFITSFTSENININFVILKIVLFFCFIFTLSIFVNLKNNSKNNIQKKRRTVIYIFSFSLIISYISEYFFGIANITGAYFAGLLFSNFKNKEYIEKRLSIISYLVFGPIFFANIGIKTNLNGFTYSLILFTIILLIVAIITKVFGCYLAARICKINKNIALIISLGMVSRGEVAIILAEKGIEFNLLEKSLFPSIIFVIIITTLITPILLKIGLLKNKDY